MNGALVVFDLDGTLTTGDTLLPFLHRSVGSRRLLVASLVATPSLLLGRTRFKQVLLRWTVRKRTCRDMVGPAEEYAKEVMAHRLRRSMVAELELHQEAGRTVIIASASPALVVEPIASLLRVSGVLATQLTVDDFGRYTGEIDGVNLRGVHKLRRVTERYGDRIEWAYSDSRSDQPLLNAAMHAVKVSRRGMRVSHKR